MKIVKPTLMQLAKPEYMCDCGYKLYIYRGTWKPNYCEYCGVKFDWSDYNYRDSLKTNEEEEREYFRKKMEVGEMSHFTVAVILDSAEDGLTVEQLLAPFQENNMEDCPEEYLVFSELSEEEVEHFTEQYNESEEDYESLVEYMEHEEGYYVHNGKFGYFTNPNAKWDWYTIGGRWYNSLLTKNGERCDSAQLKDIDWETMKEDKRLDAEETWESNPEGFNRYLADIRNGDTKESFIKRKSEFTTYAVVTPDGKWHSKGDMGWFGASSETTENDNKWSDSFYGSFIKNTNQDFTLVIVDCHI